MILIKLFWVFLKIGLFAIGGAYSFLPVLQREIVENYGWLNEEEFLSVLGLVQVFPGAISVKYATYVGYKVSGIPGVISANLGNIFPAAVIIMAATYFYSQYRNLGWVENAFSMIKIAVIAMIIAIALKMVNWTSLAKPRGILVLLGSFFLFYGLKLHPALVIIIAGLVGIFLK